MLALILLLLPAGCSASDWRTVQPPLQEVLRSLWVSDLPSATASPAGAANALRQALWMPGGQPVALLPPLFALGEAAARVGEVEVVMESLRLIEDASNLASYGGHVTPDQVTQLRRRLAGIYTQQFIPLVHRGLVSMAERSNGRAKAIAASLEQWSSGALSTGRYTRRAAIGPSAVLLSSSHWATMIITLVRGLHQHPGGSESWAQIRQNLKIGCPSSQLAKDDLQWHRLDGRAVVRLRTLTRLVEACLVDSDSIGTMVHAEGGDVNASNTAGWSPLHHAAFLGSEQLAAALLASGAAPFARTAVLGYTALHIAASRGASGVAKVLLSHEPSLISAVDLNNRTAVDIICLYDVGVLDGVVAEHGASKQGSWLLDIYRLLQDAGAAPCASRKISRSTADARYQRKSEVSRRVPVTFSLVDAVRVVVAIRLVATC